MEVEIYRCIEFTRFHQGPVFPSSLSPLENTWCKLTLASRESGGKERGEEGHRSKRGADRRRGNFRDCCEVWGMSAFCTLNPLPHTAFKTTATSPQAAIHSSSPAAALQSYPDPLTFCTCVAAWLPAHPIYPPSLNACWSNARQPRHMCSCFDHEKKELCVFRDHSYRVSQSTVRQDVHYCAKSVLLDLIFLALCDCVFLIGCYITIIIIVRWFIVICFDRTS